MTLVVYLLPVVVAQAKGIANSTGYGHDDIMRVALFPELTRMSCSMFGAWGPATANTTSKLVQLRALVSCVWWLCGRHHTHTHTHAHTNTHTHTHAHTNTHTHACTHTCTHTRTHPHIHTHAHMHAHIHKHTRRPRHIAHAWASVFHPCVQE